MDQLAVKVLFVLIWLPFITCDSVDLSAQINGSLVHVKPANLTILSKKYPIGAFLVELRSLFKIPDQKIQRSDEVDHLLFKQLAGFPILPPFVESIRSYFKLAYKSYILFQPEIKFGQCMIKYFYMRYPRVMRFFQWKNLSKYIQSLYVVSGKLVNNVVTRSIFSWFDDTELDRHRIAIKVEKMTSEKEITPVQRAVRPIFEIYEAIAMQPASVYHINTNSFRSPEIGALTHMRRRIQREANYPDANNQNSLNEQDRRTMNNGQIHYKNNMEMARLQSRNTTENTRPQIHDGNRAKKSDPTYMDPEARIDLTNKLVEREAEELFNIDIMFWRSLGIEENSFKRYSLAYCTREYVTSSFSRFMQKVVLQ